MHRLYTDLEALMGDLSPAHVGRAFWPAVAPSGATSRVPARPAQGLIFIPRHARAGQTFAGVEGHLLWGEIRPGCRPADDAIRRHRGPKGPTPHGRTA